MMQNNPKHKQLLIAAAILILGFFVITYVHKNEAKAPETGNSSQTPFKDLGVGEIDAGGNYRTTLTGTYVCLPHKDTTGPQTLECALGMKADDGNYYSLNFNLASQAPPNLATGDRFSASGVVTPTETLNSDYLRKTYNVKGVFSVTDSVEKI